MLVIVRPGSGGDIDWPYELNQFWTSKSLFYTDDWVLGSPYVVGGSHWTSTLLRPERRDQIMNYYDVDYYLRNNFYREIPIYPNEAWLVGDSYVIYGNYLDNVYRLS